MRTRPSDNKQVLITEEQVELIEEQWSIVNGMHDEYLAKKRRFEAEKTRLRARSGREPTKNDVEWSLLNKALVEHAREQNWGLYGNAKLEMADILWKESRLREALDVYLEVCYLDLNGPNNVGGRRHDPELLREFPPFDPKDMGFLAPAVLSRIDSIVRKLKLGSADVRETFNKASERLSKAVRLPLSPSKGWKEVESALEL